MCNLVILLPNKTSVIKPFYFELDAEVLDALRLLIGVITFGVESREVTCDWGGCIYYAFEILP